MTQSLEGREAMVRLNLVTGETRFRCQRCTNCCSLDVLLSGREMRALYPNIDVAWQTTKKRKAGSRFVCCLLKGADCSVYANRPLLCRLYPFFAVSSEELALLKEPLPEEALSLATDEGVRFYFTFDDNCPGMGKGERVKPEAILELTLAHLREMNEE